MTINSKEYIMQALQDIKKQLEDNGYDVFAVFLQGSQNYGMELHTKEYQSDIDAKAFVMPNFDDLYNNTFTSTTKKTKYGLVDIKDIRQWVELMKKSNPSYIELMFTEYKIIADESLLKYGQSIVDERIPIIMRACYGMILQKEKALKHPYPTLIKTIEKYGYDPKQLHHIVRLYYMIRDLEKGKLSFGEILKTRGVEKTFLLDIKKGNFALVEAENIAKKFITLAKDIVDRTPIEGKISNKSIYALGDDVKTLVEKNILGTNN